MARDDERDALWGALRDVHETGRARLLLVRGRSGSGKSRVVEWIVERAHELGAATPFRAMHAPIPGPSHGVSAALGRHLGVQGLDRMESTERIRGWLTEQGADDIEDLDFEALGLAELTVPAVSAGAVVRFTNSNERHALAARLMEREASRRPVILWVDDTQWSNSALALVAHLLERQSHSPAPILVVVTVRDEAVAGNEELQGRLTDLLAAPRTGTLDVGPLAPAEQAALVGELLGLEGDLAVQVRRRTAGNPLFAVQLVGDWVQRGVLAPGPRGFTLREGEHAELPDDIHDLWLRRLQQALAELPETAWEVLELAAALGQVVDQAEWAATCGRAGLEIPDGLVEALVRSRLAVREAGGWRMVHAMLRESLEREARESGAWRSINRRCAEALEHRYGSGPRAAERLGRHLFAGGDLDESLRPLIGAAWEARASSDHETSFELLELHARALHGLRRPASDEEWGASLALRSILLNTLGRDSEASAVAEDALERAERHGWRRPLPQIYRVAGWGAVRTGRMALGRERFRRGVEVAGELGQGEVVPQLVQGEGYAALFAGDLEDTDVLAARSARLAEARGDVFGLAEATKLQATVARLRGRRELASELYHQALFGFERVGNRTGLAQVHNELAEMARGAGDLETADEHYQQARRLFADTGSFHVRVMDVNLALLALAREEYGDAEPLLRAAIEDVGTEHPSVHWMASVALMVCAAARRDWTEWDRLEPHALSPEGLQHIVERDIAVTAEQAGQLARAMGQPQRAAPMLELAEAERRKLDG